MNVPNHPFPLKRIMAVLLTIAGLFIVAAFVWPRAALAKDVIGLSPQQLTQVRHVQTYLNAISTLKSRFLQITSLGSFAQGEFLMKRPGRMRINYDAPSPISIVSDGTWVLYKDKELDQRSYMLLSALPASMFIGEKVDFFGPDLLITDYINEARTIRITLQRNDDPASGTLTLVFAAKPLQFKQWNVVDAQGISTTVSLMGPQFGIDLNEAQFKVENKMLKNKTR